MDKRRIDGFADGFAMDKRRIDGFATDVHRIRGCSADLRQIRGFTQIRESSREFARVRESSRRIRGRIHNGYTADSRIDADSQMDSQWIHKGSQRMFTVHRRESVYGIC